MTEAGGGVEVGGASVGGAEVGITASRTAGELGNAAVDVVVVGRSLPALLAALDFAEVGLSVAIVGDQTELLSTAERDPGGELAAFMRRIAAPEAAPRQIAPKPPWLRDRTGKWAAQPEPAVFGIPAVPLSHSSLQLLGTGGAMRAYRDRVAPLLTIGKTQSFGVLVQKRLGRAVRERLVQPLVQERFGVDADLVDASIIAPGLNETLSRAGSLTAAALAYAERHVARETKVQPEGGWRVLVDTVLARLKFLDAKILDGRVQRVERLEGEIDDGSEASPEETGPEQGWVVTLTPEISAHLDVEQAVTETQGEFQVEARAIVIDHPRAVTEWENSRALADIASELPARVRLHAEIDIYPPSDAPAVTDEEAGAATDVNMEAHTGADIDTDTHFEGVELVDDWAVRLHVASGSNSLTRPKLPLESGFGDNLGRVNAGEGEPDYGDSVAQLEVGDEVSRWRAVLSGPVFERHSAIKHGGDPANEDATVTIARELSSRLESVGLAAIPDAAWRIEQRAAPFATVEQREDAAAALREQALENPNLLHVGRSLHGDDLAAALASVHSGAVVLRRHLLGLTG